MRIAALIFLGLLAGSSHAGEAVNECHEPRPEMCAQIYEPVCTTLNDGSHKQYSNSCTACSDANVQAWQDGECN